MMIQVSDPSQTGEARREALRMAERLELGEKRAGRAAIVATEIATNILKHAKEGRVFLEEVVRGERSGLQILGIDKGPGIRDVAVALKDGESSGTSLGIGLGAMRRLSDTFDLYSTAGSGTAVLCEFWKEKETALEEPAIQVGIISTPFPGERENGDGWIVKHHFEHVIIAIVDGLGHGIAASEAAREAERIVRENSSTSPTTLLQDCHYALTKTRGAAMGIVVLEADRGVLRFAGIGNVGGSIVSPRASRGLASHNGTLGHQMQRVQEFSYPWEADSLLVMHSDGLNTRWNVNSYPGIWSRHPSLVAGILYRDAVRGRDDATVLVAKN